MVDLFGKIEDGTFIGDNLGTAIRPAPGPGSSSTAVSAIWSASIELADFDVFCRGVHPSAIAEVTAGRGERPDPDWHTPRCCRAMSSSAPARASPSFRRTWPRRWSSSEDSASATSSARAASPSGIYTSGQIDVPTWAAEIEADYLGWCAEQVWRPIPGARAAYREPQHSEIRSVCSPNARIARDDCGNGGRKVNYIGAA